VTFSALVDGQWRMFAMGVEGGDAAFRSPNGEIVARMVRGPGRRKTFVTTVDALDQALADFRRAMGEPAANPSDNDHEPRLCPVPTPEPMTTDSDRSIAYQRYVSGLPYGLAIKVGGVFFDGCDERTGFLLEAKAYIDFLFDSNDNYSLWAEPENNPIYQMKRQAIAALAAGRFVVWHAQTEKGYRGLTKIAKTLPYDHLSVVFDPN
jgi:Restriction endonuclease fold toxin 5